MRQKDVFSSDEIRGRECKDYLEEFCAGQRREIAKYKEDDFFDGEPPAQAEGQLTKSS